MKLSHAFIMYMLSHHFYFLPAASSAAAFHLLLNPSLPLTVNACSSLSLSLSLWYLSAEHITLSVCTPVG